MSLLQKAGEALGISDSTDGRVWFITGCATGLGRAVAEAAATASP